jgi:hypothetical protein
MPCYSNAFMENKLVFKYLFLKQASRRTSPALRPPHGSGQEVYFLAVLRRKPRALQLLYN